jgi:hypothetical protein
MRVVGIGVLVTLVAALVTVPAYGIFGYTTVNAPPSGEKTRAQILGEDIYGGTFTADGVNYVGSGASAGITAIRIYDFDDALYDITHVYNHSEDDVDQIWTDGTVTVTAYAKYALYTQSFGWNQGGTNGSNYKELVNYTDIGGPGKTFIITEGQEFLWGMQAKGDYRCGWWAPGYEWWSRQSENGWCGAGEDHMVSYYIEGVSPSEAVWLIFMEDVKFSDGSDKDYNDFVVEIRAVPEPLTIGLLAFGALFLRRRK